MKSASRLLAVALLAGLALRLCLLLAPTAPFATKVLEPTGDSPEYVRLAANIVNAHVFSQDPVPPFRPDILRTPVYPVFLALAYIVHRSSFIVLALALQLLLSLLTVWLTWRLALELGLAPAAAALASLLVALSPNLIFYSIKLTTETLFALLLLLTLLLLNQFHVLHRWQELVASGICCGLLILARPIAVFLPLLLAVYIFMLGSSYRDSGLTAARSLPHPSKAPPVAIGNRVLGIPDSPMYDPRNSPLSRLPRIGDWRLAIGNSLLFLACTGAVLVPWVVRNRRASGKYTISTAFDYNICEYTGALTLAADRFIPVDAARDSMAAWAQEQFGPLDTNDQASYWTSMARVGWQEISARPLLAAKIHAAGSAGGLLMPLSVRSLRVFAGANLQADTTGDRHVAQRTLQLVARGRIGQALALIWKDRLATMPAPALVILVYAVLFHITLLVVFMVGLFLQRSRRLLWLLLPILYFVVSTGPVGEARFRVPIEPLLCLIAAAALTRPHQAQTTSQ